MPRPRKRRRVCEMPMFKSFEPSERQSDPHVEIILSIDEYEVIRLIDLEGLNQEACAERMEVARSTIQRMYEEAKRKVADSIVNGKRLKIEGGDYFLCDNDPEECRPRCVRRRSHKRIQE